MTQINIGMRLQSVFKPTYLVHNFTQFVTDTQITWLNPITDDLNVHGLLEIRLDKAPGRTWLFSAYHSTSTYQL